MRHHISAIKNQFREVLPAEDHGGTAMLSIILKRASMIVALALVVTASAFAQNGPIEGTVKVKGADGVAKPVEGATVTIYRTDIKGQWEVKTDKAGRYVRLGMPLAGTFIVVFSGPGMQPAFLNNVRLVQSSVVDMTANPGDGSTFTLDQVKAMMGGAKSSGPAQAQPQQPSATDKAKADKANAEYEKALKESKAVQESFDQARVRYNGGIELMKANNYSAALPEFEAATNVETSKHVEFLRLAYKANANIAEAHYQVGVDLFNKKQKPDAKVHFEKATASVTKAIELASTDTAEPNINNDLLVYYNIYAKNVLLLLEHYQQADKVENVVAIFDKAVAIDATNKNKWAVLKGDAYRYAFIQDKAAETYKAAIAADPANVDAMYGLGLTLIASSETKVIQEGANALGDFVAKAPATDKRVPIVKEALEAVKNAYKIEAEKPSRRRPGRP
jgi:tetratricopeptide (TPR) repeat protein